MSKNIQLQPLYALCFTTYNVSQSQKHWSYCYLANLSGALIQQKEPKFAHNQHGQNTNDPITLHSSSEKKKKRPTLPVTYPYHKLIYPT